VKTQINVKFIDFKNEKTEEAVVYAHRKLWRGHGEIAQSCGGPVIGINLETTR
jgi:hypothetical protein